MTLVGEDELFRAVMGSDKGRVLLTVLLISLKSMTRDLSPML
jgi:hypothetical protein